MYLSRARVLKNYSGVKWINHSREWVWDYSHWKASFISSMFMYSHILSIQLWYTTWYTIEQN